MSFPSPHLFSTPISLTHQYAKLFHWHRLLALLGLALLAVLWLTGWRHLFEEGLGVIEDTTHMAPPLLQDTDGKLHTVLSHLRSAQAPLQIAPATYLLAEQGRRDRVLQLQRLTFGA